MFARLGSFAVRFRWFIIAGWLLAAALLTVFAPSINDVAVSDQRAFLPASSPSLDASAVVKKYFPDRVSPSSAVIVVDAGVGNQVGTGAAADVIVSTRSRFLDRAHVKASLPAAVLREGKLLHAA